MIAILAEKPSVAREIAHIVGARTKKDGYLEGNNYAVTWAYGHLIGLDSPESYGYKGAWQRSQLPMMPEVFTVSPLSGTDRKIEKLHSDQLKTISRLFKRADSIIVATDAGREGELIFRYIYNYLSVKDNFRTPFRRLWISSLTDKSIREGLASLKDGHEYDNLYAAGKARSEADWLIGMNGTRAATINVGDRSVWSVGRVQTPTLCMVCRRFLENKNYVSEPYWMLRSMFHKGGISFTGTNPTKFMQKDAADALFERLRGVPSMRVSRVEKKPSYSNPPLLFDLTSIQKEANVKFGLSAETTLKICQSLYEKKLTTYPRTGSRYIPDDVYQLLPQLVGNACDYPRFADYARTLVGKPLGRISVNAAKVTDHHALLPTENRPKPDSMNDLERNIYELILGRMLESVSPREEKFVTTVTLAADSVKVFPFTVKGSIVVKPGWRAVFNEKQKTAEDENERLPDFTGGEEIQVERIILDTKHTKAPPLLTENSLLALMETAGKDIENEEEREAMKDIGIGTPATRADIIEKLIRIKYIERDKRTLVPTEKGLNLYKTVKDMLVADVVMTGKWENALNKIEAGQLDVASFNAHIREYTIKCTAELLDANIQKTRAQLGSKLGSLVCPRCGKDFLVSDKVCRCSDRDGCGFFFWREVCGRKLTERDIAEILKYNGTRHTVRLKKKDGTFFNARLILAENGKFDLKW